jgi:D-alanyl-lipoteichoic acid acyltransferase DltB (MBOAT superfamily)
LAGASGTIGARPDGREGDRGRSAVAFNSLQFLAFFAVALTGYALMPPRARWIWLLGASLFFYGFAGPVFLVQILGATALAYFAAFAIERQEVRQGKQLVLGAAIVVLVANLVAFKYAAFWNDMIRTAFGWAGAGDAPLLQLIMPLGISFYTFQLIAYLVDVFRGAKAERHFGLFSLFVLLFPKVVSGPIERAKNLLPQLHALPAFSYAMAMAGFQLMLWGAFKKIVVADRIAPFASRVFDNPHAFDGVSMTFATFLYAFQIYFDFSGYTDMALGAAMILGIKLMQNFDRPYFAVSIQDFWKRWHISLTSWLTDYLYTPLTRAKWIKLKLYTLMLAGLFITFVVSGLWHGSYWTFMAWGALHGGYIVASLLLQKPWNQFAKNSGLTKRPKSYRALKIGVTFVLVCFAYILFRAETMQDALYIMSHLATGWGNVLGGLGAVKGDDNPELLLALVGIAVVMAPEFYKGHAKLGQDIAAGPAWRRWGLHYAAAASLFLLGAYYGVDQQFIYFQF